MHAADAPSSTGTSTQKTADPKDFKEVKLTKAEKMGSPWEFRMGIPAWASGISGTTGLKGVTGHVDVPFTALLDHLDAIAPLSLDARYGKWGVHVDGQYVKLSEQFHPDRFLLESGTVEMEQAFVNFDLNYRVVDTAPFTVEAFAGGRFNYMSLNGTLESARPRLVSDKNMGGDTDWCDPILGVNAKVQVSKPLSLIFTGDVGGFGVGSHLTYQLLGGVQIQVARNLYSQVAYRLIHTDYSSGGASYNVDMSGPRDGIRR